MRRPQFIARQSRHPSGLLGRIIAAIMFRETASINQECVAALAVRSGEDVLDIGCGNGHSIALLVPLVGNGTAWGIDPSRVMVESASRRNSRHLKSTHAKLAVASVENLPFGDATFDAVMSVHTVYFWSDLEAAIREIVRVLRPGGRLLLAFRTDANTAVLASFPPEIYCIRSFDSVKLALLEAGFEVLTARPDFPGGQPALVLARKVEAK